MSNDTVVSDAEALRLFGILRQNAITNVHHRFPIYELRALGLAETTLYSLARTWLAAGWIEISPMITGPSLLGNYKLTQGYLAYMPNENRVLSNEDRERLVSVARRSTVDKKRVMVMRFVEQATKEEFYRLIEAGVIIKHGVGTRMEYRLAPEHQL